MSNVYININYRPETCGWCRGTGNDRSTHERPCRICEGLGSVLVAQPANSCAWCEGNSVDRIDTDKPCRSCDGTGWAHSLANEM